MSKFGLKEDDYNLLKKLVIDPLSVLGCKIYIFGSRARGDNHPYSDVDILYDTQGDSVSLSQISMIKESIEESRFPVKVDLVSSDELALSYKQQVDKEKILI